MQLSKLVQVNINSLNEIKQILLRINDEQYCAVIHPFTASLGKHLRHVAEHYQLFFNGLASQAEKNKIDYDQRQRNEIEECERSSMLLCINRICHQLEQIPLHHSDDEQICISMAIEEGQSAPVAESNISRELIFLHSHSIHHYAIISAILKLQDVSLDSHFGVAISTVIHEKTLKCAP